MIARNLLVAVAALAGLGAAAAPPVRAPAVRPPVVVELFTSQGCSSCPPANENLVRLADRSDVLALTYNVQVWDRLGWRDTLAHPAFGNRHTVYNRRSFARNYVSTPQTVVNGRATTPGGRMGEIDALARRFGPVGSAPRVSLTADAVRLDAGAAPRGGAEVWLVRYDPAVIRVPVAAGENGGRTLPHRNVVKELVRLGAWTGAETRFALPPRTRPDLRTAILVQSAADGRILTAARG